MLLLSSYALLSYWRPRATAAVVLPSPLQPYMVHLAFLLANALVVLHIQVRAFENVTSLMCKLGADAVPLCQPADLLGCGPPLDDAPDGEQGAFAVRSCLWRRRRCPFSVLLPMDLRISSQERFLDLLISLESAQLHHYSWLLLLFVLVLRAPGLCVCLAVRERCLVYVAGSEAHVLPLWSSFAVDSAACNVQGLALNKTQE